MKLALAALIAASACGADRPRVPAKLTLKEAMEIAFGNSRTLSRAAAQVRQAEGLSTQARSLLLPQVSAALNETVQTVNLRAIGIDIPFAPSRVGPFQTVDARASLSQNVLNLTARERDRAGAEQVRSVTAMAQHARELLAYQLALAFAQALRAQSDAATLAEQAELSRKLLETAEQRFQGGIASRLDVTRSRQQVMALEQSLIETRNTLTAAKLRLTQLMYSQTTEAFELMPAPLASEELSSESALAEARRSRPDLLAAQSQVRAAEHRLASIKAQRYPVIQLRADYGQSGRKPFENLNTFRVQGALSIPVFTGGRIAGEQVEAEGRLAELNAELDEVWVQVEAEVLAALSACEAARREGEVAARAVELARDEVELSSSRFMGGVADNTEVVNAQDRLARAEDNRVRALYRRDVATADLLRAIGSAERSYRASK
jgi:outer membrane protein TolC